MGTADDTRPLTERYKREYAIWAGLRRRCSNPNCREYRYYGARGIRVCRRWSGRGGFANFISDMGSQPFPRASVERLNNDGSYTPNNVEWADAKTQARNTRANRVLTCKGLSLILVVWQNSWV